MNKEDFVQEVCELLDIPSFHVTVGSSVPSEFFNHIIDFFNLPEGGSMPDRAKKIVEASNLTWKSDFDSTQAPSGGGGTVTAKGLDAVHRAVTILLEKKVDFGKPYEFKNTPQLSDSKILKIEYDTFDKDLGTVEHFKAQDQFAKWLLSQGIRPRSPFRSEPEFDLGFEYKKVSYLVEVKSLSSDNETDQIRYAIGQILEYSYKLEASPIILTTQKPSDSLWEKILFSNNIKLIEPDYLSKNIQDIL